MSQETPRRLGRFDRQTQVMKSQVRKIRHLGPIKFREAGQQLQTFRKSAVNA
jgi:hypothetical protein